MFKIGSTEYVKLQNSPQLPPKYIIFNQSTTSIYFYARNLSDISMSVDKNNFRQSVQVMVTNGSENGVILPLKNIINSYFYKSTHLH